MPDATIKPAPAARFAGRTALVTGAAGGIGLAIARRLMLEGCRVLLTDIASDRLHEAAAALTAEGGMVVAEAANLAAADARDRLVPAAIARWGRLDLLVNNATDHGPRTRFVDLAETDWERVFATNVTAVAALCRAAARDMALRAEGAIVNIVSIQAAMPVATYAAYVASKGAISSLTRALAVELAADGIRVNAVAPGVIATAAYQHTLDSRPGSAKVPTAALLQRNGRAEEVAAAVAFLGSADASFITGAILPVDGGRSISRRADPFETAFGERATDARS